MLRTQLYGMCVHMVRVRPQGALLEAVISQPEQGTTTLICLCVGELSKRGRILMMPNSLTSDRLQPSDPYPAFMLRMWDEGILKFQLLNTRNYSRDSDVLSSRRIE